MKILTFFVYGNLWDILTTADAAYNLFHENIKHCAIEETFNAITAKCFSKQESCSFLALFDNCKKNWARLLEAGTTIGEIVLGWWNNGW